MDAKGGPMHPCDAAVRLLGKGRGLAAGAGRRALATSECWAQFGVYGQLHGFMRRREQRSRFGAKATASRLAPGVDLVLAQVGVYGPFWYRLVAEASVGERLQELCPLPENDRLRAGPPRVTENQLDTISVSPQDTGTLFGH